MMKKYNKLNKIILMISKKSKQKLEKNLKIKKNMNYKWKKKE